MGNEATRAFWDARAEERIAKQDRHARMGALYEEACWRAIEPLLPEAGVVLEAGCGTGRWIWRLAERGLRTALLDFSPEMVRIARRVVAERGLEARVAGFYVQDICDMRELAPESMDAVLCLGEPLGLCDAPARAAAEMARVLRPGGSLVCDASNRDRLALELARAGDWAAADAMYSRGVHHAADGRPRWGFTAQELAALFADAGMEVERVAPVAPLLCFPPQPGLAEALTDDAVFARVRDLFARMERDGAALSVSGRFLLAARKPGGDRE
ncbi:MAG: methyltransferase domain-containing protein [Desulfovibrionaceae bacterium]|jgi:SAM-dependent methyltransferase|nr:methyltransferase domain-containing protein [Desulfovibrionaceae bacterium]